MTNPDAPALALSRLDSAFDTADLAAAATLVAELETSHAASIPVQVARARLTAAQGDVSGAQRRLSALVESHPAEGLPRAYLGAVLVSQNAHQEALEHLERALKTGGDVPAARQALGMALLETGKLETSLPHLQKAVTDMPTSWMAWFYLGICLGDMGRWDVAGAALAKSLTLRPNNPDAYEALARVQVEQKKIDDALATLDDGLRIMAGSENLLRLKVQIFADFGRLEDAEATLKKLPAQSRNAEDFCILATLEMNKGRWKEALKLAQAAVDVDEASPRAFFSLGLALEGQQPLDRPSAMDAYRACIQHGDPTGEAGTRLGYMLLEDEQTDDAIAELEGARDRNGGAPGTLLNLAIAYLKSDRKSPAGELAATVLEHPLSTPGMREQAGRIVKSAQG